VDFAVLVFSLSVQVFLGREIYLRLAARFGRRAAAGITAAFALVIVVGTFSGYPELVSRFHLPRGPVALFGGITHLWLYTSAAAWAVHAAFHAFSRRISTPFDPSRRRLLNAASGSLVAAPFVVVGYGALVQRTDFRVREIDIPIPDLAPDLQGLRLLQLTDIHLSVFLNEHELARVIDAANHTRAHVALVTGDLISTLGDPLDACLRQVARLRPDTAILGCMGNHEGYARAEDYAAREGARLGIRFLRQQRQQLRFGSALVNFCGVDYQRLSPRGQYLPGAERMIIPGALNVLLTHNPDVFPTAANKGFDLTVAGHTHGGQVTVEILDQSINPARFLTPFVYGTYHQGKAAAYVSRGIGTIGIPARIGAPPEISLLRLRKA